MADIKFQCPECHQKIAVDSAGAGMKIDCPRCRSGLVIPPSSEAPVEVTVRRKLAVLAGSADDLYSEVERRQQEAQKAAAEAAMVRETLAQLQTQLAAATSERDALRQSRNEAVGVRAEVEALQAELTRVSKERDELAKRPAQPIAAKALPLPPKPLTPKAPPPELEKLRAEVSALTQERDALKAESAAKLAEALDRLEKRNQSVEEMRAKLAGPNPLQTQFDGLRAEHTEVQAQLAEARKQNETLTAERDALKTAAAAPNPLQQELETVRADMATAQAELAATRTECAALKAAAVAPNPMTAELQELRDKFAAVRMENETVKGQLTMAVAERDTARKRLDEIDTVKSEAQSEAAAGRRQLATLTHERDDARKQIGAITAERDEARRQLAQREEAGGKTLLAAENARKEINRLKTEAIALTSERERLKSQCAEAASKNKELQQRVDGMLEALQTRDRAGNGGKATDNSEELAAVRQRLAEKEKALAELKAKNLAQLAAAATAARAAQKNATATLEARATAAEAEARKFAADAEIARQMVETMRTERNDAAKRVGAVEAQLHERDSEFKLANENAKMLKEKLIEADRLSNAAREMTQTVATERDRLTIDLGRLRTELSTVNEELRKTKAECDKYRAHAGPPDPEHEQLRKTESERDALKGELEAVKAGLERTKQHVNVLQTRRDQMRDEIARLKVALGQAPDAVG